MLYEEVMFDCLRLTTLFPKMSISGTEFFLSHFTLTVLIFHMQNAFNNIQPQNAGQQNKQAKIGASPEDVPKERQPKDAGVS